jgi:hypothetical protein
MQSTTYSQPTLPQWSEPLAKQLTGEDHLGIESAATSYQQHLLPGIITVTDRARYYSFYAWVLLRFIQDNKYKLKHLDDFKGKFFKRHEMAFLMGAHTHHNSGRLLIGGQKSGKILRESGEDISLDAKYFENVLGGFGQYYRAQMVQFGLINEPEEAGAIYTLTPRGFAMAQAFEQSIQNTHYFQLLTKYGSDLAQISLSDATEYGKAACVCAEILAKGADRDLLIDTFFRFDEDGGIEKGHIRRRLSLVLILDLVSQSKGSLFRETYRHALLTGWYTSDFAYEPVPLIKPLYLRWRLVQARQVFTTALQIMFGEFIDNVSATKQGGLQFDDFISSVTHDKIYDEPLTKWLDSMCTELGVAIPWQSNHENYHARSIGVFDEIGTYEGKSLESPIDKPLQMLFGLFLRFYHLHLNKDPIWREWSFPIIQTHRLPLGEFFEALNNRTDLPVRQIVEWLYRDYVIGQHEFNALEKLRYQGYNTFKFYFQDNQFVSANNPVGYEQRIRLPALRLNNALNMLIDLGLIEEVNGACHLSTEGQMILKRGCGVH